MDFALIFDKSLIDQDAFFVDFGSQHGAMLVPKIDLEAMLCQNSVKAKNIIFFNRI